MISQSMTLTEFLCISLFLLNVIAEAEPARNRRDTAKPAKPNAETPVTIKSDSKNSELIALQNCKKFAEYRYVNNAKNFNTSGQLKEIDCINAIPLIVGGVRVEPKEYPHMALIGYGKDFKDVEWLCGGSLISEKFVMSVATCSEPGGKFGQAKWVLLGAVDKNSKTDNGKPVVYEIVKRHVHPSYVPKSTHHDISLFELNSTVAMSPYIRPACLYTSTSIAVDTKASITGWGITAQGEKTSGNLLKATISVVEDKICETSYNKGTPNHKYDFETMICAGDLVEGKDTCAGDSGGPLQIPLNGEVCMWNILGITSFGAGCGNKKDPGVYTKVPYYLDWIQSIVWPSKVGNKA